MKGFINVIKPKGVSSAFCVSVVKRKTGVPCGHLGTLDPMATGVLPVGIGKATRLFSYTLDKEKEYAAEFTFGFTTDTLDTTGKTLDFTNEIPDEKAVRSALSFFVGTIEQIPPKYSAKCVDGKRGYALARAGVDFSLPPKKVTVSEFSLIKKTGENSYLFKIRCGGGTYIRSIARDLGEKLGSLCVMSALDRTKSGVFNYGNGVPLETLKNATAEDIEQHLIPADTVVNYDKLLLTEYQSQRLINGVYEDYGFRGGVYRVYANGEFWGVGEVKDNILKMKSYVR